MGRARTAAKFFFYGLLVGMLFAPRSGRETRDQVFAWAGRTLKETLGLGGEG